MLHNIAFYTNRNASTKIFVGADLHRHRAPTTTASRRRPAPGNYFFRCDVHPDTMTGTFVVK